MNSSFLVITFMLFQVLAFGQHNEAAEKLIAEGTMMEEQIKKYSTPLRNNRNHNLYIDKIWQNSAVITTKGETMYFNGRFNVLDEAIELKNKSGIRSIRASGVSAAMVGDRFFISVKKDKIKKQESDSFFEILSMGNINLYMKHFLDTRMSGTNTLTSAYNGSKEYFIAEDLYYHTEDQLCQKLPSRKNTMNLFGEKKMEVKKFISTNNLKFKSKQDLIRIFDFYNSL